MEEDVKYLRTRVDSIADTLARNTVILEKNTESLQEHIRRTNILEKQMEVALIPIKLGKWLGYIIGLLTTLAGAIMSIRQILGK